MALLALLGVTLAVPALAYGPGTHLREAHHYIDRLAAGELGDEAARDLAILEEPEWSPFFEVGAIFPDIGRRVTSMGFDAHRLDLHEALLEATSERDDPALRAFVLGAALHSMSDAAAQVFYVPWMTASTDIGVVDVLVESSDGPGGENEFFVEAFCDLYEGDLHRLVDLYFEASGPDAMGLSPMLTRYYAAAEAALGDQPLTPETFAQGVLGYLDEVGSLIEALGPEAAHRIVDGVVSAPATEIFDFLAGAGADLLGLDDVSVGPDTIDPIARARLEAHPFVADRGLYAESYGGWFQQLGTAFLGDAFESNAIIREWSTWRGPPLLAASLQSLAWTLPDAFEPEPRALVWSLGFEAAGGALTELDAASLPDEVTLVVWLFPSTDETLALTVEVQGDGPGLGSSRRVAAADVELVGLPAAGGPPHRVEARVTFDPAPWADELQGFYAVIRIQGAERPFLVTSEEPYLATAGADLTLPVWRTVFSPRSDWHPYLPLTGGGATSADVWLDVRVRNLRYPRQPIGDVVVTVEDEQGALGTVTTSAVGRVIWGPASPGTYRAVAAPVAGFAPPEPSPWAAPGGGSVAVARIEVDPVPVLIHDGFTANRARVRGRIDDSRFRFLASQPFDVAVGDSDEAPTNGWVNQVGRIVDLELNPPGVDGEAVYLFARAAADEQVSMGPVGASAPLVVDGSPPESVVLVVPPVWPADAAVLNGTLAAADPHSGVVGFSIRVEDEEGAVLDEVALLDASPAALHLERRADLEAQGTIRLVPTALNGAGLAADGEPVVVRFELPPLPEPDAERVEPVADAGQADAGDVTEAGDDGGAVGESGCGCGQAGRGDPAWWLVALLVAIHLRRRTLFSSL